MQAERRSIKGKLRLLGRKDGLQDISEVIKNSGITDCMKDRVRVSGRGLGV